MITNGRCVAAAGGYLEGRRRTLGLFVVVAVVIRGAGRYGGRARGCVGWQGDGVAV